MAGIRRLGHVAVIGVVLAVTLSMSSHAAAQTAEQEVMKVEQARIEARRKADSATLARLSSDDLLVVGPSGELLDKKAVSALQAAPKISTREVKTRMFGDVAVLTGFHSGSASGNEEQRFTRVWQRRNGQWLTVFAHVTRVISPQTPTTPAATLKVAPTQWPKGSNQEERDVLDAHRRIDEVFARKDVTAYSALTAANWVRLNRDGSETSREAFLKSVAGTPELKRVVPNHSEINVRIYGPIAVVTYRAKTSTGGDLRRSRVFVKEGTTWKQLVSQETPVGAQS